MWSIAMNNIDKVKARRVNIINNIAFRNNLKKLTKLIDDIEMQYEHKLYEISPEFANLFDHFNNRVNDILYPKK
tara:strand:- start:81 stop:302 length:222 start_codon:yes stop_codon:yes gene_type:complete